MRKPGSAGAGRARTGGSGGAWRAPVSGLLAVLSTALGAVQRFGRRGRLVVGPLRDTSLEILHLGSYCSVGTVWTGRRSASGAAGRRPVPMRQRARRSRSSPNYWAASCRSSSRAWAGSPGRNWPARWPARVGPGPWRRTCYRPPLSRRYWTSLVLVSLASTCSCRFSTWTPWRWLRPGSGTASSSTAIPIRPWSRGCTAMATPWPLGRWARRGRPSTVALTSWVSSEGAQDLPQLVDRASHALSADIPATARAAVAGLGEAQDAGVEVVAR